jgi:hypothetical protein
MIRTFTYQAIECDCCHRDDRTCCAGAFTEYPKGAGFGYYGDRIDLCDRCVLEGVVVLKGRIMKAADIENLPEVKALN